MKKAPVKKAVVQRASLYNPAQTTQVAKPRRLYLPRDFRSVARQLLAQQCWCWGQDVKRVNGNVLLQYGFTQIRPPEHERGATTYALDVERASLRLWGFGFFWSEGNAGVYVGRFDFEPLWWSGGAAPQVHAPPHVALQEWNELRFPQTREERRAARAMLTRALRWMSDYEAWALQTLGVEYRCECLQAWEQASNQEFVLPQNVPARWNELARRLEPDDLQTRESPKRM